MARVKGTALRTTVDFLKAHMSAEEFQALVGTLTKEEQELATSPVLLSGWYDFALLRKMMRLAEGKVHLKTGHSVPWEMGRASADATLNTIYKIFFKVADMNFIVRKAAYLYPTLYDSGVMEIVDLQNNRTVIRIKDFNDPSAEFCQRMQGWMQRTAELAGYKRVSLEHPLCKARGDAYCEYHGRWE